MPITIARGKSDSVIDELIAALSRYEHDHPRAKIDLYRHSSVSVRVRVVDPDLAGLGVWERHELFWSYLAHISEDFTGDVSSLVLVTPEELPRSMANLVFEDATPFDF